MLTILTENLGTIVVGLMVISLVILIAIKLVRTKKKGPCVGCDCGCGDCPCYEDKHRMIGE